MKKRNIGVALMLIATSLLHADEGIDRDKFLLDSNYTNGMMYLDGKKGLSTILKEISNCPYSKCSDSDVSEGEVKGTVQIAIEKLDYKKAVEELSKSVKKGNFLAADKLILFLIKRIDYKSKYPNKYVLEMLKNDTNLSFEDYKEIMKTAITVGSNSKGCAAPYYQGDFFEYGYLDFPKSKEEALKYYKIAYKNCREDSYFSTLAKGKIEFLNAALTKK